MKLLFLLITCLLFSVKNFAQGVKFENDLNWTQAVAKASKENKYIYVDCFATWCLPCKEMERLIFRNEDVGYFFDKNFLSIQLQFDTTSRDSPEVRKWHSIAAYFKETYNITAFPTSLYFSPDGKLVSKEIGAITSPDAFIKVSRSYLDPRNQYYSLLDRYKSGDVSPDLILKLVPEAVRMQDWNVAYEAHNRFVSLMDTPLVKSQLVSMYASISKSSDKGFEILLGDPKKINKILGDDGRAESVIKLILRREIDKIFFKAKANEISWKRVHHYANEKAPNLSDQLVMELRKDYAKDEKNYNEFGRRLIDYYEKYAAHFDHNAKFFMNNQLMEVFTLCTDRKVLLRAAKWSKRTIYRVQGEESPAAMDTYANLLYKAGDVKNAIYWQGRAVELISRDKNADRSEYVQSFDKMKSGLPTW